MHATFETSPCNTRARRQRGRSHCSRLAARPRVGNYIHTTIAIASPTQLAPSLDLANRFAACLGWQLLIYSRANTLRDGGGRHVQVTRWLGDGMVSRALTVTSLLRFKGGYHVAAHNNIYFAHVAALPVSF